MIQPSLRAMGALLLSSSLLAGCMRAGAASSGDAARGVQATAAPKLVVFITVDQLRGDMLARYESDMRHGYRRLMGGAWFTNAFQDHGITETAPGHASTMSGRFPRSTGIASNSEGVVDPSYRLLAALPNETGASPNRFNGTTLYDWIHARDSRSRALSVSGKDRGAILPIGKSRQQVYWFSALGKFTTSTYYADTMPRWVHDWNAQRIAYRYAGGAWTLSRAESFYTIPDSIEFENRGQNYTFPKRFSDDTIRVSSQIRQTPTLDSLIALFALEGLRRTGLGTGNHTDVLAVSFSATDYVGHAWGPDSREAHENQMRLDETLGWFLDSLYKLRDSASVVVALTADHGVSPIPELARARGWATGEEGLRVSLRQLVNATRGQIAARGADSASFFYDGETVALDRAALARARIDADSLLDAFATAARQVPGILRVDRLAALRRADHNADPIARRWSHQLPESSPAELVLTLTKSSLWSSIPASHGSPHDQDAHVPVIFYGAGVKPGRYTTFARVVDMAPTLAAIVGVRPLERLDGVVLREAIR